MYIIAVKKKKKNQPLYRFKLAFKISGNDSRGWKHARKTSKRRNTRTLVRNFARSISDTDRSP